MLTIMRLTILSLALILAVGSRAQVTAEKALLTLERQYPMEKPFLQYNKEFYLAGETIYFRTYVFNGYQLSPYSTNLYVVLYDKEKNVLDRDMLPLVNGVGEGSLEIPAGAAEGVYYIQAYTQWMRNFDAPFQYNYAFPVYNPASPEKLVDKGVRWAAAAFPESGRLRAGVENRVAVRLFNQGSLPQAWEGYLTTAADTSVRLLRFDGLNREVGAFRFVPAANTIYQVVVNSGEQRQVISLPQASPNALLLQASQLDTTVYCTIHLPSKEGSYKLVGQMQNQLVYTNTFRPGNERVVLRIPASALVTGVLHLTLFDAAEKALAERLVFVTPSSAENVKVQFDTLSLRPRSLNSWTLVPDTTGLQFTAYVSDSLLHQKETILGNLYLTSDFGRTVTEAASYFPLTAPQRLAALDALLLTEQWRRFNWKGLLSGHLPKKEFTPDQYLSFTGTVFLGRKLQLNKEVLLYVPIKGGNTMVRTVRTDSSGSFVVDGLLFIDTTIVYYQLNSKRAAARAIKIHFEPNYSWAKLPAQLPFSSYTLAKRMPGDPLPPAVARALDTRQTESTLANRYKELEAVTVYARQRSKRDKLNQSLSTSAFRSIDEDVYDFVNNPNIARGALTVTDWIRNFIGGVRMITNLNDISFLRYNEPLGLFLDEVRVSGQVLSTIPMSEIAMIKFQRMAAVGAGNGGGALLIYSKLGNMGDEKFQGLPKALLVGYKPFTPPLSFDYGDEVASLIRSDKRSLLAWQPGLADSTNRLPLRFYHNEMGGTLKLVVTGVNGKGEVVYQEQLIRREN
jgi:hypothetical protein